jgi:biotin carboxyl carrier protein
MKVYKVKVNGKVYEVELESVSETTQEIKVEQPKVVEKVVEKVAPSTNGTQLKAPMQGTILNIKVAVGDKVSKGQSVIILEAMKLENDVVAPVTGTVKQILVTKGQNVKTQQPLLVIE